MTITINGTTGIAGVDGTASVPAFKGNDADTGIYYPTANEVAAAAGGSSVWNASSTFGYKNRIINGGMGVAQRATSATVTAGTGVPTASTGYPAVDRFFVYSTGANVTAARVAGSGNTQFRMQITGAASVTAVGVGQRIEQNNSFDLAGGTATLSVDLANSLLTTVTWTASYANTADTFGTIGTPTKTQIATGTFTVNSTVTTYTTQISIPAAATTGIEILLTVGAQTSGTWTVGNIQLEAGSVPTTFDRRPFGAELLLCQRYFRTSYIGVTAGTVGFAGAVYGGTYYNTSSGPNGVGVIKIDFGVDMRASPTVLIYSPNSGAANFAFDNIDRAATVAASSLRNLYVNYTGNGGVVATVHYSAASEL